MYISNIIPKENGHPVIVLPNNNDNDNNLISECLL